MLQPTSAAADCSLGTRGLLLEFTMQNQSENGSEESLLQYTTSQLSQTVWMGEREQNATGGLRSILGPVSAPSYLPGFLPHCL